MNHSVRFAATGGACRVIYHAHPANIIAPDLRTALTARDFTRALWGKSATECPVVFPAGGWSGALDGARRGGEIAMATSELMKTYDAAVWAHHGLFCSRERFRRHLRPDAYHRESGPDPCAGPQCGPGSCGRRSGTTSCVLSPGISR